jgi:hypothetical protein
MKTVTIEVNVTMEDKDDMDTVIDILMEALGHTAEAGVPVDIATYSVTGLSEREHDMSDLD